MRSIGSGLVIFQSSANAVVLSFCGFGLFRVHSPMRRASALSAAISAEAVIKGCSTVVAVTDSVEEVLQVLGNCPNTSEAGEGITVSDVAPNINEAEAGVFSVVLIAVGTNNLRSCCIFEANRGFCSQ